MTAGTTIPAVPPQFFNDDGTPCVSGTLDSYIAGTTTRLDTYSDASLETENTNPVELDSEGRATIFLGPYTYKFVLKDANGVTIWTRDNIAAIAPWTTSADAVEIQTGTTGASETIDFQESARTVVLTLGASTAFTLDGMTSGGVYTIVFQTGAGSFAPTFTNTLLWENQTAHTFTTAASATDICVFSYIGTSLYVSCGSDFATT